MRIAFIFLALIALLLVGCGPGESPAAVRPLAADELLGRIEAGDAPFVLDVRTREEYARGHVPGAINVPHDELPFRLGEIRVGEADEVVVYCQSGRRAQLAEQALLEAGFSEVRDLSGHWGAWSAAGHPTE